MLHHKTHLISELLIMTGIYRKLLQYYTVSEQQYSGGLLLLFFLQITEYVIKLPKRALSLLDEKITKSTRTTILMIIIQYYDDNNNNNNSNNNMYIKVRGVLKRNPMQ